MPKGVQNPGRTGAELTRAHQEWADEQPVTELCAFCPWTYTGTAAQGRLQAAEHRAKQHPAATPTRRKRGQLHRFHPVEDSWRQEGRENAKEIAELHRKREAAA